MHGLLTVELWIKIDSSLPVSERLYSRFVFGECEKEDGFIEIELELKKKKTEKEAQILIYILRLNDTGNHNEFIEHFIANSGYFMNTCKKAKQLDWHFNNYRKRPKIISYKNIA